MPNSISSGSGPSISRRGGGMRCAVTTVVPCYDEGECLHELHRRLTTVCEDVVGDDYEIVLVNDASKDDTWSIIQELAKQDKHIVGVSLSRNHGHQLALTAGLTISGGERIFIIDADLQDPPELLGPMMMRMDEGVDVVYGQRRKREGETFFKRSTAALFYRVLDRLTDIRIPTDTGDFRLMSRRALETLLAMPEQFRFVRGMVTWIGYRQEPLIYDRAERYAGSTKYPFGKMLSLAFDAVTGFSIQPLRLASHLGIALAALSLPLIIYIFVSWIQDRTIQGWTSLMAVVVVLGSVQMFVLGMIGEYLGRTYMQTKRRPLFIIQDVVGRKMEGDNSNLAGLGFFHGDRME